MQFQIASFSTAVVLLLASSQAVAVPVDESINELSERQVPTSGLPTNGLPTSNLPTSNLPTSKLPTSDLSSSEDPFSELLEPLTSGLGSRDSGNWVNSLGKGGPGGNGKGWADKYQGGNWPNNQGHDACPPVAVSKPTTNTDSPVQQANNCTTGTPYCCNTDSSGGQVCKAGETDCKATTICCNNSNGYQICAGEVNFNNPVIINLNINN